MSIQLMSWKDLDHVFVILKGLSKQSAILSILEKGKKSMSPLNIQNNATNLKKRSELFIILKKK